MVNNKLKNEEMMYRKQQNRGTSIELNQSTDGESIEMKVNRIVNNREPITDGAPTIYTDRSEGVLAGFNPRTDRFDVALDAMDKVQKSHAAKREERAKEKEGKIVKLNDNKDAGGEPTQGTTGNPE